MFWNFSHLTNDHEHEFYYKRTLCELKSTIAVSREGEGDGWQLFNSILHKHNNSPSLRCLYLFLYIEQRISKRNKVNMTSDHFQMTLQKQFTKFTIFCVYGLSRDNRMCQKSLYTYFIPLSGNTLHEKCAHIFLKWAFWGLTYSLNLLRIFFFFFFNVCFLLLVGSKFWQIRNIPHTVMELFLCSKDVY